MKSEIEGYCATCRMRKQDPVEIDGKIDIAWYCEVFDVFVPDDGYCHLYEKQDTI